MAISESEIAIFKSLHFDFISIVFAISKDRQTVYRMFF